MGESRIGHQNDAARLALSSASPVILRPNLEGPKNLGSLVAAQEQGLRNSSGCQAGRLYAGTAPTFSMKMSFRGGSTSSKRLMRTARSTAALRISWGSAPGLSRASTTAPK